MIKRTQKADGFTLIEILVVIAIIAILIALIFPVFTKTRAMAREVTCINNLRQIGMAIIMYKNDFGELPPHLSAIYSNYVSDPRIFVCPEDRFEGKHEGNPYLEGNLYLSSGVSYTYLPNWKYAHQFGWWNPPPRYGEGKWYDSTPLSMCHWHWATRKKWFKDLDVPSWEKDPKGWILVLSAGGSVRKIRAEVPVKEFSPY
jgi:prepilin-type N-terminal cleavage/methylation domain-containing protein